MKKAFTRILFLFLVSPVFPSDIWVGIVSTGTPRGGKAYSDKIITSISRKDIENSTASSVPELLNAAAGIDIQQRGPYGVQADAGMRGAGFQQVSLMVDGTPVNDPQTAHHNFNLPFMLEDIERIEIIRGGASSVAGSAAIGGAVNIITRKPSKNSCFASFKAAEFNTQSFLAGAGAVSGSFAHSLSLQRTRSDGYMPGTEFDVMIANYRAGVDYGQGALDFKAGLTGRDFGAFDYYSPGKQFPSAEETTAAFAEISASHLAGSILLRPKLFRRIHRDDFVLDVTRPTLSHSQHGTLVNGAGISARSEYNGSAAEIGVENLSESIDSSQIGAHSRNTNAVFGMIRKTIPGKFEAGVNLRTDIMDESLQISPSLSLVFNPGKILEYTISLSRSFRNPSFTELYYETPVNHGNPLLEPEEALALEAGINCPNRGGFGRGISLFASDTDGMIDWKGGTSTGPWTAENIGKIRFAGAEFRYGGEFSGWEFGIKYTLMGSSRLSDYISKYALRYPENHVSLDLARAFGPATKAALNCVYKQRNGEKGYGVVNAKFSRKFNYLELLLEGTNLASVKYEEILGVPQPGRWLSVSIKYTFF